MKEPKAAPTPDVTKELAPLLKTFIILFPNLAFFTWSETQSSALAPTKLATPFTTPFNGFEVVVEIIVPSVLESKFPVNLIEEVVIDIGIICKLPSEKSGS